MKRRSVILLSILLLNVGVAVGGYFPLGPQFTLTRPSYTILSSKLTIIKNLGAAILGVADDGFLLFRIEESDSTLVPLSKEYTDYRIIDVKRNDDELIFRTDANELYFYDISHLPDIKFQGKIAIGSPFADFELDRNNLYLSRWFDGVWRYTIDSYSSVTFSDSSMRGILVTQLVRHDSCLYVTDEYNGIMRYRIRTGRLNEFIDYLFVPERPATFVLSDSGAMIQTKRPNIYRGTFQQGSDQETKIYDSLGAEETYRKLFRSGDLLVQVGERVTTVKRIWSGWQTLRRYVYDDLLTTGDTAKIGADDFLMLPGKTSGVTFLPLGQGEPFPALGRPGVITSLVSHGDKLITAGAANPIDIYRLRRQSEPELIYTIPGTLANVRGVDIQGDSLAVLYSPHNRIDLILHPTDPDSVEVQSIGHADAVRAISIRLYSRLRDSIVALVVQQSSRLQMIPWPSQEAEIPSPKYWQAPFQITSFHIQDSLLLVATTKKSLIVYTIDSAFESHYRQLINLVNSVQLFYPADSNKVWLFNDRLVSRADLSDPSAVRIDTTIILPMVITAMHQDEDLFYGIGPNAMGIFSMQNGMPRLLERGGKWGNLVTSNQDIVAASDGSSIQIYVMADYQPDTLTPPPPPELPGAFALNQNYPNPFNGATRISFTVPTIADVRIDIHNILGQRVRTLLNKTLEPGTYEIGWDGTTDAGNEVATGVYYYRMTAGSTNVTRKMLIVK